MSGDLIHSPYLAVSPSPSVPISLSLIIGNCSKPAHERVYTIVAVAVKPLKRVPAAKPAFELPSSGNS